jgi:glycosyltransferase involved in cell wall biosynthesis
MERIPNVPPKILPVSDVEKRYLWSVMIPAYNCSQFLIETIQSVLMQDMGADVMQIEVIDDCSTDRDVEKLVAEIGKGRVGYYRQLQNVGSLRNFETCINRSRGQYIHLLHGDDRVKKNFYKEIASVFEKFPQSGAAFCAWSYINNDGNLTHHFNQEEEKHCVLDNWLYKIAIRQRIQYVAMVVKREVYENLGSFYGVSYGEDWEMWARIAKHYPTAYSPERLAEYREHSDNSISKTSFFTGKNIRDINWVINVISSYFPKEDQHRINQTAKKHYAYWALSYTQELWYTIKNKDVLYVQIKEINKMYMDAGLAVKIAKLLSRSMVSPLRTKLGKIKRKMFDK